VGSREGKSESREKIL